MREYSLNRISQMFTSEIESVATLNELGVLKARYLGKKGILKGLFKCLKQLNDQEKMDHGRKINDLVTHIKGAIGDAEKKMAAELFDLSLKGEWQDASLPCIAIPRGAIHSVSKTEKRCLAILRQFGFNFVEGPDIETAYYF